MRELNIVFITDDNYILPTKVAIRSLISNKDISSILNINVICVELSGYNIEILKTLENLQSNVFINLINKENIYKDIISNNYVSQSALFKFQLPNIFKDLNKILYLDSDVIVEKDLYSLFSTNIENSYAGVVQEPRKLQEERIKYVPNVKKYFNSGVMLLNLKKMREDSIPDKLLECKKNDKGVFMDQNVLNAVFDNNVVYVDEKYNTLLHHFDVDLNILNNIAIYHIAGSGKPWKFKSLNYIVDRKFTKYCDNNDLLSIFNGYVNIKNDDHEVKKPTGAIYPKWFNNLVSCFILGKKNRHHFRRKHGKV